jgi:putative ABC transport system substrate-binding protein
MRELGWVHGQNVLEKRAFGTDLERVPEIAKELIGLGTDVFLVGTATIAWRVRRERRTIPIVTTNAGNLVAAGLAKSLARPGGNVTSRAATSKWPRPTKRRRLTKPSMK